MESNSKLRIARATRNAAIAVALLSFIVWIWRPNGCHKVVNAPAPQEVIRDTIRQVVRDTIRITAPVPVESRIVEYVEVPVEISADTAASDSTTVELPVVQRHYTDTAQRYEAWVSGPVDPRLDSITIYSQTQVIRITERPKPKRWGLSAGAGVAMTPRGVQPAIFIGATYTFVSF